MSRVYFSYQHLKTAHWLSVEGVWLPRTSEYGLGVWDQHDQPLWLSDDHTPLEERKSTLFMLPVLARLEIHAPDGFFRCLERREGDHVSYAYDEWHVSRWRRTVRT